MCRNTRDQVAQRVDSRGLLGGEALVGEGARHQASSPRFFSPCFSVRTLKWARVQVWSERVNTRGSWLVEGGGQAARARIVLSSKTRTPGRAQAVPRPRT